MVVALCSVTSYAQTGFVGGFTSGERTVKSVQEDDNLGFHAGLVYKLPLVLGITLQGGLMYDVKGSTQGSGSELTKGKIGYAELPLQIQWGPDLRIIRPYVFAEPFVGYAINNDFSYTDAAGNKVSDKNDWSSINRFAYGLGAGIGLELFKFLQVSAKYYWNFDSAAASDRLSDAARAWWEGAKAVGKDNFTGMAFSVGIFF